MEIIAKISRSYNAISGSNIKIYANCSYDSPKFIPEFENFQGLSFKTEKKGMKVEGTLIFVLYDKSIWPYLLESESGSIRNLYIESFDEKNEEMKRMDLLNISFNNLNYGLDINDIITEELIDFSADLVPWRVIDNK